MKMDGFLLAGLTAMVLSGVASGAPVAVVYKVAAPGITIKLSALGNVTAVRRYMPTPFLKAVTLSASRWWRGCRAGVWNSPRCW